MRSAALLVLVSLLVAGCTAPTAVDEPDEAPVAPLDADEPSAATPSASGSPSPPSATPSPAPASPAPSPSSPPPSPSPSSPPAPSEPREPQPFDPEDATEPCDSLELRSPLVTDTTGVVSGWSTLTLDVALLADSTFVEAHPADWRELLEALARDASARYEPQVGLALRVTLVDAIPAGKIDPSFTETQIIPVARGHMLANHPDVPHDIVATVLGADYAGNVAGMADCVGGGYTPDRGYFWAEYTGTRGSEAGLLFKDTALKVFMHEAAHLLGAHHHYSDCGEAVVDYSTDDVTAVCDVMINDIGFASFRFGPTNRLVMRSFVEEWKLGEPAS